MGTKPSKISLLKFVLFTLLLLVAATFLVFLQIRNQEHQKTNAALEKLQQKDPGIDLIKRAFDHLSGADHFFKLYTLTHSVTELANYRLQTDSLIQTLEELKAGFDPEKTAIFTQTGKSIEQKIDISANFYRLKSLTDSLLTVAVCFDSIQVHSGKIRSAEIKKIDQASLRQTIDTLQSITTTEKRKQGLLGKIKTFVVGGTEQTTTTRETTIQTADSPGLDKQDNNPELAHFTDVLANQADSYYRKQLRIQKANRDKLDATEKELILTNVDLMSKLNQILNLLNRQLEENSLDIRTAALQTISDSTKKLNKTVVISTGIIIFLILSIIGLLSRIIKAETINKQKLINHLAISEEKYRNLIESATDSILIIKKGVIEYVNRVLIELSGYTEKELIGTQFLDYVSPDDRKKVSDYYTERQKNNLAPITYESSALLKDGSEMPVEVTISTFSFSGELAELVFLRDIRDRKLAAKEILESKTSFENLFENTPVSIWEEDITLLIQEIENLKQQGVTDFETYFDKNPDRIVHFSSLIEVLRINKETLDLYEANSKEELLSNITQTFLPESFDVFRRELIALSSGETKYEAKTRVKTFRGKTLDVIVKMFTSIVENKHLAYVTTIDISKQTTAENEIRQLNEELEQRVNDRTAQLELANKDLESFAYSVSHDLRAPIRHIEGFTKILKNSFTNITEEQNHFFNRVTQASMKMSKMIDDLLKFSRLGRKGLNKTQVDLNVLIDRVISQEIPEPNERQIEWKIDRLPIIEADESLLQLAFENLISNALKFTSKNDVTVIEIRKCRKSENCVLYIKDNGIGFDMKYADKLFGVFQRLHAQEEYDGTGIGLANVKQIIQKHGGTISAESEPDKGATFIISL